MGNHRVCHQNQDSEMAGKAGRTACALVQTAALRLSVPQDPPIAGKIRHRGPRRPRTAEQAQMVRLQKGAYILRYKGPVVADLKEAADNIDAPRSHRCAGRPFRRPHQS